MVASGLTPFNAGKRWPLIMIGRNHSTFAAGGHVLERMEAEHANIAD